VTFCDLDRIVVRNEVLEWGVFRGEGEETHYAPDVALGEKGRYTPLPTITGAPELNRVFAAGTRALTEYVDNAFERGCAFFLFGALRQLFFDGDKRTSRFMMNGVLMSNGIDAISVPAQRAGDFNEKMVGFYTSKDATEMMAFLEECQSGLIRRDAFQPKHAD
jgi:prophage maintenance system killer protein